MSTALDAQQQAFVRVLRLFNIFERINLVQSGSLSQAIIPQTESDIVGMNTDCQGNAAGQIVVIVHYVTSANG